MKILYRCLILAFFQNCTQVQDGVSVVFTSEKMVRDFFIENRDTLFLNEYYTVLIKNNQYDTLSLNINNLGSSVNKAMLPNQIDYYIGDSIVGDVLITNYLGKNYSRISICKHQEATLLFLMPDFSDRSKNKTYSYLVECINSNKKQFLNMKIKSNYGLNKYPVKVEVSD
jgi:hypothetical protein